MAARNYYNYEYETSPRKVEPEIPIRKKTTVPKRTTTKSNRSVAKQTIQVKQKQSKQQAKMKFKMVCYLIVGFAILFTIGYRNSQIDQAFAENQEIEKQISNLKKENEQLNVAIQNSLNLSQIEKEAKERLGMQKLTSRQTVYVDLPKKDYIEGAEEEIIMPDEEPSLWDNIIEAIKSLF